MEEIKKYAYDNKVPIILDDGLTFILNKIKELNIKNILELGSAIGYSAINMAKVNNDIKIVTIERNPEMFLIAKQNINKHNLENSIKIINKDIDDYDTDEKFEMIFVDAGKAHYLKYLEKFSKNLKKDGIMIFDNLNFHDLVYNIDGIKNKNKKRLAKKLKHFYDSVMNDVRYQVDFYKEVGDGILVLKRRNMNKKGILFSLFSTIFFKLLKTNDEEINLFTDKLYTLIKNSNSDEELSEGLESLLLDFDVAKLKENFPIIEDIQITTEEVAEDEVLPNQVEFEDIQLEVFDDKINDILDLDLSNFELEINDLIESEIENENPDSEVEIGIIDDIKRVFPNLSENFIKEYYALKDGIASEYESGREVVILHRISFKDIEILREFVETVARVNYHFNVDEEKLIVDIFRSIVVSDGKILNEIFTIADYSSSLEARYEGYLVE